MEKTANVILVAALVAVLGHVFTFSDRSGYLGRLKVLLPTWLVDPELHQRTVFLSSIQNARLRSLRNLAVSIQENQVSGKNDHNTILVGGKGGVGKTTVSSALAVALASSGLNVLVASTDPAHSLGDALDTDLSQVKGQPMLMTDKVTGGRLYACEVDANAALEDFRKQLASFEVERMASALGVTPDFLQGLGLQEFSGILNNPPPGFDELVALSNILDVDSFSATYDVVIVDTAPTGHTLRLLALPQFLDGLLGQLIKIRLKLAGVVNMFKAFFGNANADQQAKAIDDAANRLETFRRKMSTMRKRLNDASKTNFVAVTVPTKLGVAETKRLVAELGSQGVQVTDVVVNQCVQEISDDQDLTDLFSYFNNRKKGQGIWIDNLAQEVDRVSRNETYKMNGSSDIAIRIAKVPYFHRELVGASALAHFGAQAFENNPGYTHLMVPHENDGNPRVVISGGKGGVGKTTTASSLAVAMASKGLKVALISTDPAHSLGDAIDLDISNGELTDYPLTGIESKHGVLSVMEVNPAEALSRFKGMVDQLISGTDAAGFESGMRSALSDLEDIFSTLPAGADEVIALAKVVTLVKEGGFDRIVLDTAPTGHTRRMLATPGFLADLVERLLVLAEKVSANPFVRMMLAGSITPEQMETAAAWAKNSLRSFQSQMYQLKELFTNADETEFLIVTIPTELAARESIRLLNDLTFEDPGMPIKVRNVVINQVLSNDEGDIKGFLSSVSKSQIGLIREIEDMASSIELSPNIVRVHYHDKEPRGSDGLKVISDELLR